VHLIVAQAHGKFGGNTTSVRSALWTALTDSSFLEKRIPEKLDSNIEKNNLGQSHSKTHLACFE
jgi:hypothetical protein